MADVNGIGSMPAEGVNGSALHCPKCRVVLPEAIYNLGDFAACPHCGVGLRCEVFPARYTGPRPGRAGETLVDAQEASCFFHPDKRAFVACDSCGRFLCALCDLDFLGRHICPSCLSAGRKKGSLGNLDHSRFSWSGLALLIAVVPLITIPMRAIPIIVVTAPAAIVVGLIGMRKPPSLTGGKRIFTLILAMTVALAEIVGSIWFGRDLFQKLVGG